MTEAAGEMRTMPGFITRTCDDLFDWVDDRISVVMLVVILLVIALIVALIWAGMAESRSPVIELKKTEWQCTGTRSEPYTYYINSANVMVPVTSYHDVCVEYTRR